MVDGWECEQNLHQENSEMGGLCLGLAMEAAGSQGPRVASESTGWCDFLIFPKTNWKKVSLLDSLFFKTF